MKILFVSAVLPYPLKSGGQIRMYNLLKRLSVRHEITLVSFIREESERAFAKDLGFCKDVIMVMRGGGWQPKYLAKALTSGYPFLLATYDNAKMRKTLEELIQKNTYDVLHIEPFYVWPSIPPNTIPLVVSEHNIEYAVYEQYVRRFPLVPLRPFLFLDILKLRRWEKRIWQKAASVTVVSPEDAQVIQKHTGKEAPVVANGVDLAHFPFQSGTHKRKYPRLLFVGDFRWFPNQDAVVHLARDIWPRVKAHYSGAVLRIVGRHFSSRLEGQILKAGAQMRKEVDDIAGEYRDADILVAPHTIAGGTKFKMLEAMATGLPIVTTSQGMAGLAAVSDVHYLKASTPAEYVVQITKIWENKKVRDQLVWEARALVENNYSWESIAQDLEKVWKETKLQ